MEKLNKTPKETAEELLARTPNVDMAIEVCDRILSMTSLKWVRTHYLIAKGWLILHKYMPL